MANTRGFTALELLMALLLLGLGVVTVFHYTRVGPQQARNASCSSNVRQLALALLSYAQDNSGKLPPGPREWDPVTPYIKNSQVYLCPAERGRTLGPGRSDYLFNYHLQSDDRPQSILVGDDVAGRHRGRRWVGARLDGAVYVWPADQWQTRIGTVSDETPAAAQ